MNCSLPIVLTFPETFLCGNAVAAGVGISNTIGQLGLFVAPYISCAACAALHRSLAVTEMGQRRKGSG